MNSANKLNSTNPPKVPPLIIKKNKIYSDPDNSEPSTPNSDNEFRSPRKTARIYESPTKNTLTPTPNRFSPLDNIEINDQEMPTSNNNSPSDTQTENQNNHTIQTDSSLKIPPLFITNISQFPNFRLEISKVIKNDFTASSKYDKIKVNVETIDDFRTLTKFLDEKKYEYFTYRLKGEKDISAIIRNLPISITELEVKEELSRLKFPVKSVVRLKKKDKTPTPLMAIQLENNPLSLDIFKLNKLLNCIIITEPRRKSSDPPQCTNCQRYGHIHKSCKLKPRCVKCNASHHYSNCNKIAELPPTCVNCNDTHPANYKGCTYFKTIKNNKSNNYQKHSRIENQLLTNPASKDNVNNLSTETPNLISYADITKGKTNTTFHPIQEQIPCGLLNDNLQKTISEFIENIFQNIQTIISSIFNSISNNLSLYNKNDSN